MSLWKKITHPYLKWRYFQRAKNPYLYKYKEVKITVFPEVFSPKGTITTELFADYLIDQDWRGKSVLELGAGSGLISFLLANRGAKVTASDISESAATGLNENNSIRENKIEVIKSDLFQNINNQFDIILVNPPFFAKKPISMAEMAWYCGENHEYFQSLFSAFSTRNSYTESILMVLSINANIQEIFAIAGERSLRMEEVASIIKKREKHFIFKITNK